MKNFAKKLLSGLCVLATLSCYGCGLLWGDSDSSSGGETVIENSFVDEIFNGNYTQISGEELAELAKTVEEGSPKRIFSVNEGVIVRNIFEGTGDGHIGDGEPLKNQNSRTVIQKGEGVNGSYCAQCNATMKKGEVPYDEYSTYDDGMTLYTKQWRDGSTKKEKTDSKGLESYYSIFTLLGGVIGEGSEGFEATESSSSSTVTTASGGTEESVEQEMIRDLFSLEQYAEALEISESDEEGELTKYMLYQDKTDSNYIKIKVELAAKIKPEFEGDGEKILIEREVYFIYDVGSRELVAYSYNYYQEIWYYDGDGRSYEWGFSIAPWSGTITPPSDLDTYSPEM